ncbi:MAG: helix-turn-helix domain-containing protein [Actinomycetota bacterium]|nr:helix-turn-helix domain-containing protein [Actinomycetota bacterium]
MIDERMALLQLLKETSGPARRAGDEHYFRTSEVATILRVSVRAVRSWADDGKLPCVRTNGGHRLFPASGVKNALERMEGTTTT